MVNTLMGIAFASQRFGFVVIDSHSNVIDYGVGRLKSTTSNLPTTIQKLLRYYNPATIYTQDTNDSQCRLGTQIKQIINETVSALHNIGYSVKKITKSDICSSLSLPPNSKKELIIAQVFSNHSWLKEVPYTHRNLWGNEHWNTPIFMAMGLLHGSA